MKTSSTSVEFENSNDLFYLFDILGKMYDTIWGKQYKKYIQGDEVIYTMPNDDALILFLLICESENISE